VGGLLGTTFTGQMDELEQINDLLAELERDRGWRIPLHIDAASGGFIVPFSQPELTWDFRLSQVRSINVSNHKFGLVYPGMGTVIFRERADVPEELVFHINYLGGDMPNYSLNFSRPSSQIVLQYYNFLRLGHAGYEQIVRNVLANAQALARRAGASDALELINDGSTFPVVVVKATDPQQLDLMELSRRLRCRGWIVPAYTLPANAEDVSVLRMVVKENFSRQMVDMLGDDLDDALADMLGTKPPGRRRRSEADRPIC
jgi:glutamate decarboxylase